MREPPILVSRKKILLAMLSGLAGLVCSQGQQPAFPGALGFGAYATGGRGGTVYHVTNLSDSGAGSFRDAVSHSGRIVVFDVGGHVKLNSAVAVQGNITIAGQTAPGGISFDGGEISFSPRSNIICRYLRIRPGSDTASTSDDCLSLYKSTDVILDHCSFEFGPWNNIDAVTCDSISVQHCIDANPTGQQFGAHTENLGAHYCWTYNIFANSHNRNPLAKINTVFVNNVDYNCSAGYTTHTSSRFSHDIVNNYFVAGPASSSSNFPWYQIDNNQSMYFTGNLYDANKNASLDGGTTVPLPGYQGGGTILSAPWSSWTAVIPTMTAPLAWRYDVSTSGAFPRDDVDSLLISQVKSLGNGTAGTSAGTAGPSGGLYTSQAQTGLSNNGYGAFTGLAAIPDSDGDGMPDYWELANGLNPNVADSTAAGSDGYSPLEDYLNWLAAPHAVTQTNTPVTVSLAQFTGGFSSGAVFAVTNAHNGTVTLLNNTNAQFVPGNNFSGIGFFNFVVNDGGYVISATVTICVTPVVPPASATQFNGALVGVSVVTGPPPSNLLWRGDGIANIWDNTTSNWLNGASSSLFKSNDVVTFDDTGSNLPAINLATAVSPNAIYINANQNYTMSGAGALTGSGPLSKTGSGALTINTANNSYSGSISVDGGTLTMGSGSSLGSGTVALTGGATFVNGYPSGTQPGFANPFVVPDGQAGAINLGNRVALTGNITGAGTLNFNVQTSVSRDDLKGNASAFTGMVNFLGSGTVRMFINGGAFTGFDNALATFNAPVAMVFNDNSYGNAFNFGALAGNNSSANIGNTSAGGTPTLNIGALNMDTTFAGQFQGPAALNKNGAGTLTLTGNSTHTGATTVNAGALVVNGTFTASPVTVAPNATLAGGGALLGGVTVQSGGVLAPAGTLTVSNDLSLTAPTIYYDLSGSPGGANDAISMQGGALALAGTQNLVFNLTDNALGAGTYNLIAGATNSTLSSVSFTTNLPGTTRQTFAISLPAAGSNPSYVRLNVTGNAAALVWKGTNGSAWDLNNTVNWLNNGAADKFYNLDFVRFDDSSTNGTVTMSGTMQPISVTVSNNSRSFTIGGGTLGGVASITKAGPGSLILNSSNSFSGGISVNGGTLQLANNGYAASTGSIALNGGTLFLNGVGTGATLTSAGTNALQTSGQPYATFNLQGTGWLDLNIGGGGVFSPSGDWSGFSGTINFTTGNWMRELNTTAFGSASAVWNFGNAGGLYNKYGGAIISLGALFGGGSAGLSGASTANATLTTYVVGGLNTNSVFSGTISDGGAAATALTVVGPGSLTLNGASAYTGGTTVSSGTLCVNNATGSGTGSGDLEVFSGATLTGTGIIGSATTIDDGATLAPGNPTGTLTFTNNLTLSDNSLLAFTLGTSSDSVTVDGDLNLTGLLSVTNGAGFGPGSYTLFTCAGALAFGNLMLVAAPAGYSCRFDTNSPGVVKLVVAQPQIGYVSILPSGLVMSGFNGPPGGSFYLLSATNLAEPLAAWTRVLTNQFDSSGNFVLTNAINPQSPQNFCRLQMF